MPLYLALLLSLAMHLLLALPSLSGMTTKAPAPVLTVQLPPEPLPDLVAQDISTVDPSPAAENPAPQMPPPSKPTKLQGKALQRTQTALARHLLYPQQAVEQGLEGVVTLLLVLDASGRVLSVAIANSSGHALLDQAAMNAAQSIGALPGNPRETLLPVTFRLE